MRPTTTLALFALASTACTVVDTAVLPQGREQGFHVTTADVPGPYDSLGVIQASHRGVYVLGFIDPAETSLQAVIDKSLVPRARAMGGDAIVNLRFERLTYLPVTRVFAAITLVPWLPAEVNVRGEVVKFRGRKPWEDVPPASASMAPTQPALASGVAP